MKKTFIIFCVLVFVFPLVSKAQENPVTEEETPNLLLENNTNGEEYLDTNVEASDIGNLPPNEINNSQWNVENVTLLPDSPLYFLKTWWEGAQQLFTRGLEKKAALDLKFANRRILELKKLCEEKDKCELAEKLAPRYQGKINSIIEKLKEAKEKGQPVEDLTAGLKETELKSQEVMQNTYDKVPPEVKTALLSAMESTAKGVSEAIKQVQNDQQAQEFQDKIKNQIENYGQEVKNKVKERFKNWFSE